MRYFLISQGSFKPENMNSQNLGVKATAWWIESENHYLYRTLLIQYPTLFTVIIFIALRDTNIRKRIRWKEVT